MNNKYNLQEYTNKLKNMSINKIAEELDKYNEKGKLFLKKEKDLTEKEKEILQEEIKRLDNAEYIPFEKAMEELYQYAEELKNERIQDKIRLSYSK